MTDTKSAGRCSGSGRSVAGERVSRVGEHADLRSEQRDRDVQGVVSFNMAEKIRSPLLHLTVRDWRQIYV